MPETDRMPEISTPSSASRYWTSLVAPGPAVHMIMCRSAADSSSDNSLAKAAKEGLPSSGVITAMKPAPPSPGVE